MFHVKHKYQGIVLFHVKHVVFIAKIPGFPFSALKGEEERGEGRAPCF